IGSEGGFDASEAENAIDNGIIPIWLGERILRCETAPVAAISIIMNLSGNI
ncbi:MAG: RsmE family RNA methyltransferase, partial [Oscillospiraceae bacterium]|nr:RsmE family RNA methyltransferase [Oscillospiraceae bacterium]